MLLPCMVGPHCSHVRGSRGDQTLTMGFWGGCTEGDLHKYLVLFPTSEYTPWMVPDLQCSSKGSPRVGKELTLAAEMAGTSWGIFFPVALPLFPMGGQAVWQAFGGSAFPACLLPDFYFQCVISVKDFNNHFPRT